MIFGSEAKVKCLRVRATPSDAWMPPLKRRRRWRARWRRCGGWGGREREGKQCESNRIIILILCQIASRKEMLHNMHEERKKEWKNERRKEAAISLCTADTARRKRRLQGCVSQRICTEFKCLPPAPLTNECTVVAFVLRPGPHAELNVVLISRNLCHNYFLIIPNCATGRHRTSLCVCNGLKI